MRRKHRMFRNDPEGLRLPVKLDATSNGEFAPIPLDAVHRLANETAMREATRHARGLGLSRREFLVSAAGTATALLAMNAAYAAAGNTGGFFAIAAAAAKDPQLAQAQLNRGGFIFDVQGHFVDPGGQWLKDAPQRGQGFLGFPGATRGGERRSRISAPISSSRTCSSIRRPTAWCSRSFRARSPPSR